MMKINPAHELTSQAIAAPAPSGAQSDAAPKESGD